MFAVVPLKTTKPVDMVQVITPIVEKTYSKEIAANHSRSIEYIQQARSRVLAACSAPSGALEIHATYLACLRVLELKFPGITIKSTWSDSLKRKNENTIDNILYEKLCVSYNIAASLMYVAASQPNTDDGNKAGSKLFRHAAGWFRQLRTQSKTCPFAKTQVDLEEQALIALERLCLAQSTDMMLQFVLRSFPPVKVATIANDCSKLYGQCEGLLLQIQGDQVDNNLVTFVTSKKLYNSALAHSYMAQAAHNDMKYGDEIGFLTVASRQIEEALASATTGQSRIPGSTPGAFSGLKAALFGSGSSTGVPIAVLPFSKIAEHYEAFKKKVDANLATITHDNSTVYYQTVTSESVLPKPPNYQNPLTPTPADQLDAAAHVPITEESESSSASASSSSSASTRPKLDFQLFPSLVPMELLKAVKEFQEFTQQLLQKMYDEDEEVRNKARGEIEGKEMPKTVLDVQQGSTSFSAELVQKVKEVRSSGGYAGLDKLLQETIDKRDAITLQLMKIQNRLSELTTSYSTGQYADEFQKLAMQSTMCDDAISSAKKVDLELMMRKAQYDPVLRIIDHNVRGNESPSEYASLTNSLVSAISGTPSSASQAESKAISEAASLLQQMLNAFQEQENKQQASVDRLRKAVEDADIQKAVTAVSPDKASAVVEAKRQEIQTIADGLKDEFKRTSDLVPPLVEHHTLLLDMVSKNRSVAQRTDVAQRLQSCVEAYPMIMEHIAKGHQFYDGIATQLTDLSRKIEELAKKPVSGIPYPQSYPTPPSSTPYQPPLRFTPPSQQPPVFPPVAHQFAPPPSAPSAPRNPLQFQPPPRH